VLTALSPVMELISDARTMVPYFPATSLPRKEGYDTRFAFRFKQATSSGLTGPLPLVGTMT